MFAKINSLYGKVERTAGKHAQNALGFGIVAALLLAGCATTRISSVWKDQSYKAMPRKIMIIGIAQKPANKRTLEDEFASQINALGTKAVASYNILADDKDADKEVVAAKMQEQGADTVLITRVESRKTVYTKGGVNYDSPPPYYVTWRNYYEYGYNNLSLENVAETKYALLETNIYDAGRDKLVWSASSETEVTGSDQKFIKSYVSAIVENMVKQNLLKKKDQ